MTVEMTVTAIDMPTEKPLGERIKFKLEFALLMLNVGRVEMAGDIFDQIFQLIEQIDNKGDSTNA